ncbi:hypothetical protein [Amycolatopsis sp. NPDC051128]|uniref:hypothetical protein n=1 Tax=Amycolatopsis sp. NPDC051128 TaxID=3155412 RepID=UPI003449F97E
MTRAQWRQLAHRLRAAIGRRPEQPEIPPRLQLDLWAATEHRIAAQRRPKWL